MRFTQCVFSLDYANCASYILHNHHETSLGTVVCCTTLTFRHDVSIILPQRDPQRGYSEGVSRQAQADICDWTYETDHAIFYTRSLICMQALEMCASEIMLIGVHSIVIAYTYLCRHVASERPCFIVTPYFNGLILGLRGRLPCNTYLLGLTPGR